MLFFKGFTLAELLVALLILGEISTFTIPKILSSQQQARHNAVAKETAAAIAEAYYLYKLDNTVASNTLALTILDKHLNYVKRVTTTAEIDSPPKGPTITRQCSGVNPCYYLHNGGILRPANCVFGGTSPLNAVYLMFDMDGVVKNTQDSVEFVLYFSGRLTSTAQVVDGTVSGGGCNVPRSPDPLADPYWFSW